MFSINLNFSFNLFPETLVGSNKFLLLFIPCLSYFRMSNNLDVRIAPNGHPYVCLSQVPPLQTLPHLPQISHPLTTPQVAISPLSQLAQLPQHINMPNAPFDQVLNSSVFSLPPPPVGVSVPNPFLEALTAHFMSLQPTFNAIFPFGANSLSVIGAHKTPVPLMSLRISTPPAQRAHPYQMTKDRSDQV